MKQTTNSSYDDVIYTGQAIAGSHPDRLSTLGTLFGMKPVPVTKCRVLELGCGTGGNIIPMASNLPDSEFVGVDLSGRQVKIGKETVLAGGLENTRLFLEQKQADNPGLRFNTLPRFDEVVLFE